MRIALLVLLIALSGCTNFDQKDLKSPCVSISSPDGAPIPCVRRGVNDHWLS